jgi:hypothetical protein
VRRSRERVIGRLPLCELRLPAHPVNTEYSQDRTSCPQAPYRPHIRAFAGRFPRLAERSTSEAMMSNQQQRRRILDRKEQSSAGRSRFDRVDRLSRVRTTTSAVRQRILRAGMGGNRGKSPEEIPSK